MTLPPSLHIPPEVREIAQVLEAAGHETWCVGGAIRDALLGDAGGDFDLATAAPPEVVQRLFRRTVPVGLRFGTVGVLDRHQRLHEVTTFRRDVQTDGRHAVVEYGVSLVDDLARRDFTINAIAYHPLRNAWADPFGGEADLAGGVVRAVGEAAARFREDYLRILRGLRFAARLDFAIEPATWAAAVAAAPGLAGLSAERVRDEWFKGLRTARTVARLVTLWRTSGAAAILLPELGEPAAAPGADRPPRDPVVLTAALCTAPEAVLRRLKAPGHEIARAAAMARGPLEPAAGDDASVRRWLSLTGGAADDLIRLWEVRHAEQAPWAAPVAAIRARGEPLFREDLAVTGHDLLAAGVPRGPGLGRVLDRLLDRVLAEPALNTPETLLRLARDLLDTPPGG